jgi:hypothetical protein
VNTGTFPEYLGDVSTEALLQNLTNINEYVSSIDAIRLAYPRGFTVTVEMELPVYDKESEKHKVLEALEDRFQTGDLGALPPNKKLVRLVLEPNDR